jgi:hypothetical protein
MVYPGDSIADTLRDIMHIGLGGVETLRERLAMRQELPAIT